MRRRIQVIVERRERPASSAAEEALVRGAGEKRRCGDVRVQHCRRQARILDTLDGDGGDDLHALHCGGDMVARESTDSRLDVHCYCRRALELGPAEWAHTLATVMRVGPSMLIQNS